MYTAIAIAVALSLLRIIGVKTMAFQAVAHAFCGGLIAYIRFGSTNAWYLLLGLSVVETICFFRDKRAKQARS